jgi:glycosyltransferase involved in cell wall biosynthesis
MSETTSDYTSEFRTPYLPGSNRPLVTFALMAYNQEQFVHEAVKGALLQDYQPLQIILSDDCSTDRTFEVMRELAASYDGPNRVCLNRNATNLGARGIGSHVNRIVQLAEGGLIVMAAGDDISLPHRTRRLVEIWINSGKPSGSLYSAAETFVRAPDERGKVIGAIKDFGSQTVVDCIRSGATGVLGAAHAVTADLFDVFGPLPEDTLFEDRTLVFRSLLAGSVIYCPEVLVRYRIHSEAVTAGSNYSDPTRWLRWNEGGIAKYKSFRKDYELWTSGKTADLRVLREIDKGIRRAERSRELVTGTALRRAVAAFFYSWDFKWSNRIRFIIKRAIG